MGEATDRPDSPNVLAKWARASRENCSRDLEPVGLSVAKPHWMVDSLERVEASDAVLPLPAICFAALRLHHQAQTALEDAAGPFWIPTGHVFTTRDGLPLDPRNFHRAFKARSAKAGVRAIPVHGTRHTCGSLLAALDVHPRGAMQILRHSKIAVTMEIYTHIPSDLTRTALHRLGDQLEALG